MFEAPFSTFLNYGALGAALVISLLVNGWLAMKREQDRKDLIASYERRIHDAQIIGEAYNKAVNGFTELLRDSNRQSEQSNAVALAISKGVEQLLYRQGGQ